MGADMFIAIVPAPVYENGKDVNDIDLLMTRVTPEAIDEVRQDFADGCLGREHWTWEERAGDDINWLPSDEDVRDFIREAIEEVTAVWRRDLTSLRFDDRWHYATGGLSHGDPPTDSYESVVLLNQLGIFEEPFPNPEETT